MRDEAQAICRGVLASDGHFLRDDILSSAPASTRAMGTAWCFRTHEMMLAEIVRCCAAWRPCVRLWHGAALLRQRPRTQRRRVGPLADSARRRRATAMLAAVAWVACDRFVADRSESITGRPLEPGVAWWLRYPPCGAARRARCSPWRCCRPACPPWLHVGALDRFGLWCWRFWSAALFFLPRRCSSRTPLRSPFPAGRRRRPQSAATPSCHGAASAALFLGYLPWRCRWLGVAASSPAKSPLAGGGPACTLGPGFFWGRGCCWGALGL